MRTDGARRETAADWADSCTALNAASNHESSISVRIERSGCDATDAVRFVSWTIYQRRPRARSTSYATLHPAYIRVLIAPALHIYVGLLHSKYPPTTGNWTLVPIRTATRSCRTRKRAFHFCSPGVVRSRHAAAAAAATAAADAAVYSQSAD